MNILPRRSSAPRRQTILITGASGGLGEGMARRWAAAGHHLALCARRVDVLEQIKSQITALHPDISVKVFELDVSDHEAVQRVFVAADTELGGVDRFVLNAGLGKGAALGTGKAHANLETTRVNAVGMLNQMESALDILRPRGAGHIVVMSSVSALRGMKGAQTAYGATKAFASALAEGVHAELADTDIAVTTILPGYIRTDINRSVKTKLMTEFDPGCDELVATIDREPVEALVPAKPWAVLGTALRYLPEPITRKMV